MMKQVFEYLEYDLDPNILDCDITNKLNEDINRLFGDNLNYKILDFKTNIISGKQRANDEDDYLILGVLVLIEYDKLD